MSDQGTHFINHTIREMMEEFTIQHKKSTPYHLQANETVEKFNKVLEHTLTNVCNVNHDDWDLKIPVILWAYRMMCKRMTCHTPFKFMRHPGKLSMHCIGPYIINCITDGGAM